MPANEKTLVSAVLVALAQEPRSLSELVNAVREDVPELSAQDDAQQRIEACLVRLVQLRIVESSITADGTAFYTLAAPLDALMALLRSSRADPWPRLEVWGQKTAAFPSTLRGAERSERGVPSGLTAQPANYYIQQVWFATDRQVHNLTAGIVFTANRSDGDLTYGRCEVSIPNTHELGLLEAPSFLRLEWKQDPAKHVALLTTEILTFESFAAQIRHGVDLPSSGVLVFVHGYNVRFEDAVRRTAQLAYDLQFDGVPIAYSWPSRGDLLDYTVDENNAEWAQPHFQEFLESLAAQLGPHQVNIIAHSMGNRLVARTLANLSGRAGVEKFSTVVLAAPDIDRGVFLQIADAVARGARQVVLYASSFDRALRVSKMVHGYPRAGESDDGLVVCEGIQTVDVSTVSADFTGHGYFGNNVNVVADLYYLLRGQLPRRFRLRRHEVAQGIYWAFVP